MADKPEQYTTRLKTFGRRHGHTLRANHQALVDELLPKLRVPISESDPQLDVAQLFGRPVEQIWFEVGFGGGEHAAQQVEDNPHVGLIACEPFINGVASLLSHVEKRDLHERISIWDDDARFVLDALPDQSLDRLFLLFPDPWRKNRHAKRRFIGPQNLELVARVLKPGGEFRVASDHMPYIDWTLSHLSDHADFKWCCEGPKDWRERPADWPATRYEKKALAQGKYCIYLRFVRC